MIDSIKAIPERIGRAIQRGIDRLPWRRNRRPESPQDAPQQPDEPTLAPPSTGGDNTFLWKPVSETTRNLVILLPARLGRVDACTITHAGGTERGRWGGIHNGNRAHYRFGRPGAGYGRNITVTANDDGAEVGRWTIPDGAGRFTAR